MKKFNYKNAVTNLIFLAGKEAKDVEIYTYCVSVAKSGMSRVIKAFYIKDNTPYCLGEGSVRGCGMDMGYHVAETIFSLAYSSRDCQKHLTHRWL